MIVTRQKQIPLHWILLAVTPWGAVTFTWGAMSTAFLFSLKKFVENPAELTFILTLPGYISIFLAPACNFLSDRIWTRVGRRKPFIITSWIGIMISLVLMPLTPNLWTLIAAYMLFCFSLDIGSPLEALKQEIVPPHQRGRATAAMAWLQNGAGLVFSFVALGRFDDVRSIGGHLFSGETLIYWSAGLLMLVTFVVLTLGIKEMNPKNPTLGGRLSIGTFFTAILDRDLWPVYMLIFGAAMLNAGLGPLGNLLYTDQWGYSKQDMGTNIAVGGVLNIFIIGLLALVADRLNRMRAYQVLITASLIVQFSYFLYVEIVLPDHHPSLVEIILFGETLSILGTLTAMVYIPLVYDYVTRDKMGTYGAGAGLLNKLTSILTLNAIGLFIWGYAVLFQPPAGEMVRVCLKNEASLAKIHSVVNQGTWTYPEGGGLAPSSVVHVEPWYATGITEDKGTCWEVRLRDKKSETWAEQREDLQSELSLLQAQEKTFRDEAEIDSGQNKPQAARQASSQADAKKIQIQAVEQKIAPLDQELDTRADDFQQQVTQAFRSDLLPEGEQIVKAATRDALVVDVAVNQRPTSALEKNLVELRRQNPGVIDVRPIKDGSEYGIAVSALFEPGVDEEKQAQRLADALALASSAREPGLFPVPARIIQHRHQLALVLQLRVVGEPLDTRISPVTRLVDGLLALFDSAPQPERRVAAMARSLRLKDESEHVDVQAAPGNTVTVSALLLPRAARSTANDLITVRLRGFLGRSVGDEVLAQIRAFYDRVVDAGATQRIVIEQPVLEAAYAPLKYDYMCGYIGLFLMGLIGLAITFAFVRREKKGLIRKLGAEEAAAS
jgi:Na+/melibiose symporter-like transporter